MKKIIVILLSATCVMSYTQAFAASRAAGTHTRGTVGMGRLQAEPPPPVPNMQQRIPAPLSAPARAPTINGPLSPNGLPSMGNGIR